MIERPIIFSADMVRAILDGRKTQTRRVAKYVLDTDMLRGGAYFGKEQQEARCPYGAPGDRLWVRERWRVVERQLTRSGPPSCLLDYAADPGSPELTPADPGVARRYATNERWRPSIHMPRWASRLTLEVVSVRVERVQAIGARDALAEGAPFDVDHLLWFRGAWDSINGKKYPWESNPWVFVIEFRRVP